MESLNRNGTWTISDLLVGRKPKGSLLQPTIFSQVAEESPQIDGTTHLQTPTQQPDMGRVPIVVTVVMLSITYARIIFKLGRNERLSQSSIFMPYKCILRLLDGMEYEPPQILQIGIQHRLKSVRTFGLIMVIKSLFKPTHKFVFVCLICVFVGVSHVAGEPEKLRAVAFGSSWVAAITSVNFLRIFTDGSLQIGLDGIQMLHPSSSRTLRAYPLNTVTRCE
nr:WD repeat and HMG-box DNA-binding protein 1 [Tanacetum cinerariifolium]